VALERPLRKHQHAVVGYLEHTTAPLQQLDRCVWKGPSNLGRQTGGPGFVVSNDAVADRDVHWAGCGGQKPRPKAKVQRPKVKGQRPVPEELT
jgi:hypothetical protein